MTNDDDVLHATVTTEAAEIDQSKLPYSQCDQAERRRREQAPMLKPGQTAEVIPQADGSIRIVYSTVSR